MTAEELAAWHERLARSEREFDGAEVRPSRASRFHAEAAVLIRAMIDAALSTAPVAGWRPTHRHVKRGTDYEVIGTALLQAGEPVGEAAALVVYRGQKGDLWVRPEAEFDDGRFAPLVEESR